MASVGLGGMDTVARGAVPAPDGDPVRVLLIEDDPGLRDYLAECLRAAGCHVAAAANGLDGWHALEAARPDVLALDLDVPVMSGFRVLRLLRRAPAGAHLPVVVMTGYDLDETRELVREARPDAYLTKPFAAEQLTRRVQELAAGARAADP